MSQANDSVGSTDYQVVKLALGAAGSFDGFAGGAEIPVTSDVDAVLLLRKIYKQLTIMNIHLAAMTGEKITSGDLGD